MRMLAWLAAAGALVVIVPSASAAPGDQLWVSRYGQAGLGDEASALGVSPDGSRVFVTGVIGRESQSATVAYDTATGTQLWDAARDEGSNYTYALAVSPDGSRVFVAGSTSHDHTIAYNAATGAQLWASTGDEDVVAAIGVSPDGSKVFVTGQGQGSGTGLDYVTTAYDAATGGEVWVARYASPTDDQAFALGVSAVGVFVTGVSGQRITTVAYDAATGRQLWTDRFNNGAGHHALGYAIGVSPDGSEVVVTGAVIPGTGGSEDYATIAYEATSGARLWAKLYNGPGNGGRATAVGISPNGAEVFVTGISLATDGSSGFATIAYDAATGARLWVTRYDPPGGTSGGRALAVSPDGSEVLVTGTNFAKVEGYSTLAYDAATGARKWARRYNHQTGYALALGISPDGSRVFVTGGDRWLGESDFVTVAYSTG
jgi:outer membrane protein assembly factor BamB